MNSHVLFLIAMIWVAGAANAATNSQTTAASVDMIAPFAEFLGEVSARRQRVVYGKNSQTLFDGVQIAFVNTASGNLTFARSDLAVVGLQPIVVKRIYDSRLAAMQPFGPGWALNYDERIEPAGDGRFRYVTASAAERWLIGAGAQLEFERAAPTDVVALERVSDAIEIRYNNGLLKRFSRIGDSYRLSLKRDRYGNEQRFYHNNLRLLRIELSGSERFVAFDWNAAGQLSELRDDAGRTVRYRYDQHDRLIAVEDLGGATWHYEYDRRGRLTAALAPGGDLDIAVDYAADARVTASIVHGVSTRFHYAATANGGQSVDIERDGAPFTKVGHDSAGRVINVTDVTGSVQGLRYTKDGRVQSLVADDKALHEFEYDDAGYLLRLWDSALGALSWTRGDDGRPQQVTDAFGGSLATVRQSDDATSTAVRLAGRRWRVVRDANGALREFSANAESSYRLTTNPDGRILTITDAAGQTLSLRYDAVGRPEQIVYPDGFEQNFEYGRNGLRQFTRNSAGVALRYYYTPAGNLRRYEVHENDLLTYAQNLELNADYRLSTVVSEGQRYEFTYNRSGELARTAWNTGALGFGYDAAGRFDSVILDDGTRLEYRYGARETDLRWQTDVRTPVANSGFADLDSIDLAGPAALLGRNYVSTWQVLRLDTQTLRFELTGPFGAPLPESTTIAALARMRLLDFDTGDVPALASSDSARNELAAPSNSQFIPGELWSLNCNICPPEDPHTMPGSPSTHGAADRFAAIAHEFERCPGGGHTPPAPDCSLTVTGLDGTMCRDETAAAGTQITPTRFSRDNLTWYTNGNTRTIPTGARGPNATIKATAPGNGRVWTRYLEEGKSCTSAQHTIRIIEQQADNYSQLQSTVECPERTQNTALGHEVDGCSIPLLVGLIFPGTTQDPVGGEHSAPGTSTAFGLDEGLLAPGAAPSPLPCNRHDVCYQTCTTNQATCDDRLLADMRAVCNAAYPNLCPHGSSADCIAFFDERADCTRVTDRIFLGLRVAGRPAYEDRQVDYCKCCD